MLLKSINPANSEVIAEYPEYTAEQVNTIITCVNSSFKSWRKTALHERMDCIKRLSSKLEEKKELLAGIITSEMGKNIMESRAEVEKCVWLCNYYFDNAEDFLKIKPIKSNASESYISFQPLGVILAIMPWNFPFWQVFRCAIPTLLVGNTMVLKHASNVSGCALAIEELFRDAEFPEDVLRTVLVSGKKVESIIAHKRIVAVTLTGSEKAGRSVAQSAGSHLKKCVLELGGSDPYVILDDADLDIAVQACVKGRLLNAGQSCIGAKRFIATPKIYDRLESMFVAEMKKARIGNPFDENNKLGPLAREDIREELIAQVNESLKIGAQLLCGGQVNYDNKGFYYPATVLSKVKPGMPAYNQEMFGPVAALIKARDEADAIRIANDTNFGLGAAVFTSDIEKGKYLAEFELEAGCCFVNDFVKSDPRLPFGGIKESGYGRELSIYGAHEFANIKTVYIK